jgi:uncharacterized protein (DUF3820 family)
MTPKNLEEYPTPWRFVVGQGEVDDKYYYIVYDNNKVIAAGIKLVTPKKLWEDIVNTVNSAKVSEETTTSTFVMKDTTLMPFGKHKGKPLANVPPDYLLYLLQSNVKDPLLSYIKENFEVLKSTCTDKMYKKMSWEDFVN